MSITLAAVTQGFVAEIGDVDLAKPLSAAQHDAIQQAFRDYAVLIFPEQQITEQQHLAFAELFGPLETNLLTYNKDASFRITPDLVDISNLTSNHQIWERDSRMRQFYLGNQLWHTDSSFKYLPARASLLYARTIAPVGGHTEFADLRAAWDALPAERQHALDGLVARHALAFSREKTGFTDFTEAERAQLPPVPQVLARTLPDSGRRSLYLAAHAGYIDGMPTAEGHALLDALMQHATQRQFVYTHRWRVHDLVMWDNRCTMHRGIAFDDQRWVRDMHRATVSDCANTCEQEGIAVSPIPARLSGAAGS